MLEHRDFITPTLGSLPWFEKPPLLYWLMAASYRLFGVNEYAARFAPALCGLITAAFIWWTAKSIDEAERKFATTASSEREVNGISGLANWSTLVFLSSLGAITFSRAASFDIVLTMTLTGAFACFLIAQVRHNLSSEVANATARQQQRLLFGFYVFI